MEQALTILTDNTIVGWDAPDNITHEQWRVFGTQIRKAETSLNWIVGDWLLSGWRWGEMYKEAMELTGWTYDRLRDCKRTAEAFQFGDRSPNLAWSTHYEIAKRGGDRKLEYLQLATDEAMSKRSAIAMIESDKPLDLPSLDNLRLTATLDEIMTNENTLADDLRHVVKVVSDIRWTMDIGTFDTWIKKELNWSPMFGQWVLWLNYNSTTISYEEIERFYFGRSEDIELSRLVVDHDCIARTQHNYEHAYEYADEIKTGDIFPPLLAVEVGGELWLSDGFYRKMAYQELGIDTVCAKIAKVAKGEREAVFLGGCRSNARHGRRLTAKEKKRALWKLNNVT